MNVQSAAANAKSRPPYTLQKTLLDQKTLLSRNAQDAANALLAVHELARTARPAVDPRARCWALDQSAALVSTRFFKHFKGVAHSRQFALARETIPSGVYAAPRLPFIDRFEHLFELRDSIRPGVTRNALLRSLGKGGSLWASRRSAPRWSKIGRLALAFVMTALRVVAPCRTDGAGGYWFGG